MPQTSPWPLSREAVRFLVPGFITEDLARHPLASPIYPLAFGYYPLAAGHTMAREHHEDNLVIYCRAGGGRAELGNGWQPIHAGQWLVLPRGTPHRYEADVTEPWSIYWVHYEGHATVDHHAHWGITGAAILDAGTSPVLLQQFNALLGSRNTGYQLPALIQASTALAHLFTTAALEIAQQVLRQRSGGGTANDGLLRAREYMESHLQSHVSLDQLARVAGLSRWHFTRSYQQAFGYSPIQHFIHRKIERACERLNARRDSITSIAFEMGYDDPAYFSRLFRRITGLSPQAYQRSLKG